MADKKDINSYCIWRTFVMIAVLWSNFAMIHVSTQDLANECYNIDGEDVCLTVPNVTLTWSEAFEYCANLPSTSGDVTSVLARVYTSEAQRFLEGFLSNNSVSESVWISARTEDPETLDGNPVSQWRWVYDCDTCSQSQRLQYLRQHALNMQGCYADNDIIRDMTVDAGSVSDHSACQVECDVRGYSYAGLQTDQTSSTTYECRCGERFGRFGPIKDCANECGPSNEYNCGGGLKNFVYRFNGHFGIWGYKQPDNEGSGNKDYCAGAKLRDTADAVKYRYYDYSCAVEQKFLCAYDDTTICETQPELGYYNNMTSYGACVYVSDASLTWYNARQFCRDDGGDLITFSNYSEHEDVMEWASIVQSNIDVYVGVSKYPLLWKRVYQDAEMSYYNLDTGEPQFEVGECLLMKHDDFKWKAEDCEIPHNFICLTGPDDDPAPTTTTAEPTTATQSTASSSISTTPNGPTSPTTSLVGPTSGGSTDPGRGLNQTEKILIGVLSSVGALLLILLVLFLVLRKKKRDEPSRVTPSGPKERIDARLKAAQPESGKLWDINEGYHDMGSTANLMYAIKKNLIPKWRGKAKRSKEAEPQSPGTPEMLVRRNSGTESVLVPDLLEHAKTDGTYGYGGPAPEEFGLPQVDHVAMNRSYGSIPGRDSYRSSQATLPGEADRRFEDPLGVGSSGVRSPSLAEEVAEASDLEVARAESPQDSDTPLVRTGNRGSSASEV